LETNDEEKHAISKLEKKNFDMVVLNSMNDPEAGFGYDTNKITIIQSDRSSIEFPLKSKQEVAKDIADVAVKLMIARKEASAVIH
jgi:phosphopantothenoylcysteine decarboxylase / phosphopantothenate---cysteine ligase